MDEATGLMYIGNGQYYDPATGRFLTRDANPTSPNPYVPGNPLGLLIGPLALLGLFYARRRTRNKWDTLFIFLVLGGAVAMSLSACGGGTPTAPAPISTATPDNTATPVPPNNQIPGGSGTDTGDGVPTPTSPANVPSTTPPCPPEFVQGLITFDSESVS